MFRYIIFGIFVTAILFLLLFLYACLRISSECSREEERRDAYKNTRRNIEKSKN